MIRLKAALCLFMLSAFCFAPPLASGEFVIELPVLAAIRANNKGVFELLMMWWDQKQSPEPIQLHWLDTGVHLGGTKQGSLAEAFAYAVERTPNVRHSGTVSVRGFAYASATSDGPSAGAAMAVGFIAMFKGDRLHRGIAMTGTIEPGGRVGPVGAIPDKMRAAAREGYRTILVPTGQIYGPTWNLNQVAMELNLIVKEVDSIDQAYELMTGRHI
jgi:hypothetical protein